MVIYCINIIIMCRITQQIQHQPINPWQKKKSRTQFILIAKFHFLISFTRLPCPNKVNWNVCPRIVALLTMTFSGGLYLSISLFSVFPSTRFLTCHESNSQIVFFPVVSPGRRPRREPATRPRPTNTTHNSWSITTSSTSGLSTALTCP